MKTHTKGTIKKALAFTLALGMALTVFADTNGRLVSQSGVFAASSEAKANKEAISSKESEIEALEKKQAELDEKINSTAGDINAEKENQEAISEQINTVEQTLHTLAASIDEMESEIAVMEQSISEKEAEVAVKKQEILDGVSDFKKRLRAMYIAGNDSYTDILVGASDFYDMLMKLELVKRVATHDTEMIDELIMLKEQYETEQNELNSQKEELETSLEELQNRREKQQTQMEKLEGLYSESEKSLADLEADKALYEGNKEQIAKEEAEFEASLQELYKQQEEIKKKEEAEKKAAEEAAEKARKEEEERKKKEEEERKNNNSSQTDNNGGNNSNPGNNENNNSSGENNNGNENNENSGNNNNNDNPGGGNTNASYGYVDKSRFTWPVPGFYHISYGVGWRWGAYHKGIDIYSPNIRGANIIAADAGTVIYVSNTCPHDYGKDYSCGCGGGYGNYCIIDHGDGYWTLYGHSEKIIVSYGQHVEKGTILGTVGSTGHSTGPHLHFEVRLNGTALDPSNFV